MAQLRSVTCHMGSHSVTCYPTQVNTTHPALTPAMQAGTWFTYPGGMEGWVDLIAPRPRVEPSTFQSRVQRSTSAATKTTLYYYYYYLLRGSIHSRQARNRHREGEIRANTYNYRLQVVD